MFCYIVIVFLVVVVGADFCPDDAACSPAGVLSSNLLQASAQRARFENSNEEDGHEGMDRNSNEEDAHEGMDGMTSNSTLTCIEMGNGGMNDGDSVYGCGKHLLEIWPYYNAADRDANGGIAVNTLSKCYSDAMRNPDCGGRVEYHRDGIRCYCLRKGAWCKPKNKPSYLIADCSCGFHRGTKCEYEDDTSKPAKIDSQLSESECYTACMKNGGSGCCQYNKKSGSCRMYDGGASPSWMAPIMLNANNKNKGAFMVDDCH